VSLVRLVWSSVKIVVGTALLVTVGACDHTPTSPSNNAPFSQADLRLGTGDEAVAGQLATVNYTGWYYNAASADQKGAQFDSSIGTTAFTFVVGVGDVIAGWDRGVPGMKVGGIRRLVIPPSLAYGSARSGSIPPNATLVFEIELLRVGPEATSQ
jgi:FKBP-type peptidyl-prolyl cis-trans isomerase